MENKEKISQEALVLKKTKILEFPGGLAIKDLVLSLLWLRFDPWPGNFHMPWAWPKKKVIYAVEQPSEIRILIHLSDLAARLLAPLRRIVSVMGV